MNFFGLLLISLLASTEILATNDGIGTTVSECNGKATYTIHKPETEPTVIEMPAIAVWGRDDVVGLAMTVFAYTDIKEIASQVLPLRGNEGQVQMRLALPTSSMPVPPAINSGYLGKMAISSWDSERNMWSTLGAADGVVVITGYQNSEEAWNDKTKLCSGKISGSVGFQAGAEEIVYDFEAVIITPRFPK